MGSNTHRQMNSSTYVNSFLKEEYAKFFFNHSREGVIVFDRQGQIMAVNPAVLEIYGYSEQEILSMNIANLCTAGYVHFLSNRLEEACAIGQVYEVVHRRKDGSEFWAEVSLRGMKLGTTGRIFAIVRDIHRQKELDSKLNYYASHDYLTGLPAWSWVRDSLAAMLSTVDQSYRLGLLFLDIDRFRLFNNTYNHAFGDLILNACAKRLKQLVKGRGLVTRSGGDQFIILLFGLSRDEEMTELAKYIQTSFKKPLEINGKNIFVTFSIGMSISPTHGTDGENLMNYAEKAMYQVKRLGGDDCFVYSANLGLALSDRERLELENKLRQALHSDELTLYYQPRIDLKRGSIVGIEALIRWNHGGQFIAPGEFIPIAEESGLIIELGEWVMKKACAQVKAWQDAGLPFLKMSVNISPRQLRQEDFVKRVRSILEGSQLEPSYLELEITEGSAMEDIHTTIKILSELRGMGVSVAIDDFGTGFCSLNYLRYLPIDVLKIDQSFIRGVDSCKGLEIVKSIIQLGHNLRLLVVAEGVETEEQICLLGLWECDHVQGYYFGPPMPAQKLVEQLVKSSRCRF